MELSDEIDPNSNTPPKDHEGLVFTKGPNAQALSLQQKFDGVAVRSLKQQYITPISVQVPSYKSDVVYHAPILHNSSPTNDKSGLRPSISEIMGGQTQEVTVEQQDAAKTVLDGFMLLAASGHEFPDNAQVASLVDKGLTTIVEDDLSFFSNLIFLDVSENRLYIEGFSLLRSLQELRLACNGISHVQISGGFDSLLFLDLSYNKLTMGAISSLRLMPKLKELDLCGNKVSSIPPELALCPALEKIMLDNNKIHNCDVLTILSKIKTLREIGLAYNFIDRIPTEACIVGSFYVLEYLDVSFNYISKEEYIMPLLEVPRIETLLLYGNPVLGPSGEDPMQIYIEEFVNTAMDTRDGVEKKTLEVMTEIPKRRRPLRKGEHLGRQTVYRDFTISHVDSTVTDKTNRQWREEGTQTLFAESIAKARKDQIAKDLQEMGTFITAGPTQSEKEGQEIADKIADDVMMQVADSMDVGSNAELLLLKDMFKGQTDMFGDGEVMDIPDDKVPNALFGSNMSSAANLETQPMSMNGALRALRFAIGHPLTNYHEVPAKGFLPPHDYVRPTIQSTAKQKPRISQKQKKASFEAESPENSPKKGLGPVQQGTNKAQTQQEILREKTFSQIDDVLSSLNESTLGLIDRRTAKDNVNVMKEFARPHTGITGIVDMVNTVLNDLDAA